MKFTNGLCILYLLLVLCSCSEEKKESVEANRSFIEKSKLVESESISLPLDSLSAPFSKFVQLFDNQGTLYIVFLSNISNKLYFYDFLTKKLNFTVQLATSGPNRIGTCEGFKVHSLDSIIVTSRYTVSIVDTEGIPSFRFNLLKSKQPIHNFTSMPQPTSTSSINLVNRRIYIDAMPDVRFTDLKALGKIKNARIVIDIDEKKHYHDLPFPENYSEEVYGIHYLMISSTYNQLSGKFIYSFPAFDNLIEKGEYNDGYISEHYAGSHNWSSIPFMSNRNPEKKEYHQHFFQSPSYELVLHDKYRDVYYRYVKHPISDEDFENHKWGKRSSIVILDSRFNKIGETLLDEKYISVMSCITPKGLAVGFIENEDQMNFTIFTLETNKLTEKL